MTGASSQIFRSTSVSATNTTARILKPTTTSQISTLRAGFTAAALVLPGATGAFNGTFPASLIHPDRNNYAPRIGIAWRPLKQTVVRTGYGINYNLAQYANIIQNFAFQPPFANTATNATGVS